MVKKWESDRINIGVVKPYYKITVTFKCLESLEDAVTVTSSCSCSSGTISGNTVIVSYNPGDIPKHLLMSGSNFYHTNKSIKVYYKNGEYDMLQFNGNVKR